MKKLHALITTLLVALSLIVSAAADTVATDSAPVGANPELLPILVLFAIGVTAIMVWFFKHKDGY